jgi:8-oxo-dGTP pyrophosphatase MutT (NUDIX family)
MTTHYVLGFMFDENEENHVVLLRKSHPDWQAGKLNGVGGEIREGECSIDAMDREFREEIGVPQTAGYWQKFATLRGVSFNVACFRGTMPWCELRGSEDEPAAWYRVRDLSLRRSGCISNLPWLLEMAHRSHAHDWSYNVEEKSRTC